MRRLFLKNSCMISIICEWANLILVLVCQCTLVSHAPLLNVLSIELCTLIFAKRSLMICHENLLKQRQNKFYHDYKVAVATAENGAGLGVNK
ncbi:hypothetical protein EZS27_042239, partial [termite gut metagenome]